MNSRRVAGDRARQVFVESRRVGRRANLDRHVLQRFGLVVRAAAAGRSSPGTAITLVRRVRVRSSSSVSPASAGRSSTGMPPRVALLQLFERVIDGAHFEHGRRLAQREAGVVAGIDRRQRLEVGDERQRLAFFEHDVLDVRRRHRLEPALPQRARPRAAESGRAPRRAGSDPCSAGGRPCAGTLPGRKPGTCADREYASATRSISASTTSGGTSKDRCLRVSETSVNSVFIGNIMVRPRFMRPAASLEAHGLRSVGPLEGFSLPGRARALLVWWCLRRWRNWQTRRT